MTEESLIPVVYYHSIGNVIPFWYRNFLTVSPEAFRKHLEYFSRNFTVISLKEMWLIRTNQAGPVRRPLVITFDDGYSDNWTHAFPLIKEYGIKATIFVSPEFVDRRDVLRAKNDDPGFLSWKEMKTMEESKLIDIQSHTLTHSRYFMSDRITGFHHPGGDILYPATNAFPERKTDHIGDPGFDKLLPYGFPIFEDGSAAVTRKVTISQDFINECIFRLSNYDFGNYDFKEALRRLADIYDFYRKGNRIIEARETEKEYIIRVREEIFGSKKIIEEKLNKKVEFLCWPHGDNNEFLHRTALEAGYLMTTTGKASGVALSDTTRIPERLGVEFLTWQKRQKTVFKLNAFSGITPYHNLLMVFRLLSGKTRW
jgi:hypothetical protein